MSCIGKMIFVKKQFTYVWSTIILMVLSQGCVSVWRYPVSSAKDRETDSRLVGEWRVSGSSRGDRLRIRLQRGQNRYMLTYMKHRSDGNNTVERFQAHTSQWKGRHYLNIKSSDLQKLPATGWIICKYRLSGNILSLWVPNNDVVIEAIRTQKLSGEVIKKDWFSIAQVLEKSQGVRKYLLRNEKDVFQKAVQFRRVVR